MTYITRTGLEVPGVDLKVVDGEGREVPQDGVTVGGKEAPQTFPQLQIAGDDEDACQTKQLPLS